MNNYVPFPADCKSDHIFILLKNETLKRDFVNSHEFRGTTWYNCKSPWARPGVSFCAIYRVMVSLKDNVWASLYPSPGHV